MLSLHLRLYNIEVFAKFIIITKDMNVVSELSVTNKTQNKFYNSYAALKFLILFSHFYLN